MGRGGGVVELKKEEVGGFGNVGGEVDGGVIGRCEVGKEVKAEMAFESGEVGRTVRRRSRRLNGDMDVDGKMVKGENGGGEVMKKGCESSEDVVLLREGEMRKCGNGVVGRRRSRRLNGDVDVGSVESGGMRHGEGEGEVGGGKELKIEDGEELRCEVRKEAEACL